MTSQKTIDFILFDKPECHHVCHNSVLHWRYFFSGMSTNRDHIGLLFKTRFEIASFLLKHPAAYWTLCHTGLKRRDLTVTNDTEIVIEGYPRSANSFSVNAFKQAQQRPVKIAHHHHAQAQVIKGVRHRIPVCVLIRNPADAVRSLLVLAPKISIPYAILKYLRFYHDVYPYREGFVVGPFEEVINSFDITIQRINERFGTAFDSFEHNEEALSGVFGAMERHAKAAGGTRETIGKPTPEKEKLKRKIDLDSHTELLDQANDIYHRFLERAP